jgi:hypothetical protein
MSYHDWHVGMKVVCVDDDWDFGPLPGETFPKAGAVYTIRSLSIEGSEVFVQLAEIVNPVCVFEDIIGESEFAAVNFRPVQPRKTDISIFTAMLDSARERETA